MNQLPPQKLGKRFFWTNISRILDNSLAFHKENFERFGDIYQLSAPPLYNIIATANPNFCKHVLQSNQKNYEKDKAYDLLAMALGKGLVTNRGESWKKQRKIAQPTFHRKNMEVLYQDMLKVTEMYLSELDSKRGQELDIAEEMTEVTARIVMKALFNEDIKGELLNFYEIITFASHYISNRIRNPLLMPLSRLNGAHKKFLNQMDLMRGMIHDLIEKRLQNKEKYTDFLEMMLDARYEDTGEAMPRELLIDELLTIFSAGHETSANALAWTFYLLSQNPSVVQKLKSEIQTHLSQNQLPQYEGLRQMPYSRQVIEEAMRLYPPAWGMSRYAIEDDEFEGISIKKNTIVILIMYHLHRNPKFWDNPEVFDPENFNPELVKNRPLHEYMPFGAGPRMCIGNHFAMIEMQLLLIGMMQRFNFELSPHQQIEYQALITLRPKYGIKMKVQ